MKTNEKIQLLSQQMGQTVLSVRTLGLPVTISVDELCALAQLGLRTLGTELPNIAPVIPLRMSAETIGNPPTRFVEMAKEMHSQDNRMTSHPMFVVRQERAYGLGTQSWERDDTGEPVTEEELAAIEDAMEDSDYPSTFCSIGDVDYRLVDDTANYFEWVTVFFTNVAAEKYIADNAHNLRNPHVYVASGWRNDEWQAMRAYLLSLTDPTAKSLEQEVVR